MSDVSTTASFPPAVPEMPVTDLKQATQYYKQKLGFHIDWVSDDDGIAGVSQGHSRIFLTSPAFRESRAHSAPTVIWFNLDSKAAVNLLYEQWHATGAVLGAAPESKPWKLHEFTARDLDGNQLRVFYDFSRDA